MRITAGEMRSRIVPVANVPGLRPTPAKVRQALFNMLGSVEDFDMLDLFSGSGIMALEALSRGAKSAQSIELHHLAAKCLQQTREHLKLEDRWHIKQMSVEKGIKLLSGSSFDLIFADPPYAQGEAENVLQLLDQHGITAHQLVIEESARYQPLWPEGWICQDSRRYGDSCLHFLLRK
ncbi:16S rRNA (guanine(966)-N(2))-methyltransferase RsmD [Mariprofundus sp. EBB-1]|uniref:16S rRNA (guanine(966)-N(2))-methyltransferase RsmD n=1 Tax=Mariprofundus sp. EBB-1 TaxID=2650971 RepID=UPI000EF1F28C|nr:16S rRNA (guanine(966)-N(2))-methyltransferase RsmD [Mariprofundus sp. EBB-1]RLL54968.1 16S rRNA (guanine(966)-N(2))-methyltransferase RsmD [Mariprofundus sp. EBB-1]